MTSQPFYREIRAQYDNETITVYQAYKTSIADAAVQSQKLTASPDFKPGRMTWIKPSWAWVLYRSGYSYKDPGQSRILALKMKHERFAGLLEKGLLSTHRPSAGDGVKSHSDPGPREKSASVRIQWDPERSVRMDVLPYRSIQIGIPGALSTIWANEWIVGIEDVTERARELKRVLDERPEVTTGELQQLGLLPLEEVFQVSDAIKSQLEMDLNGSS